MPTFGSLFAGIGGIDLGLERAGWTGRWQVEWDDYCQRVLAKHWPDVPRAGDIRDTHALWDCPVADAGSEHGRAGRSRRSPVVGSGISERPHVGEDGRACKNCLEPVDLIAGGFPCQPFSVAGKRLGKADERWLWPEFARVVGALRPRYVLVENVPGLLAGHGGMGAVLGDLAEFGYDAEWDSIPAAAVGAPHLRYRVWIVGYRRDAVAYPGSVGQGRPTALGPSGIAGSRPPEAGAEPHGTGHGAMADADGEGSQGYGRLRGERDGPGQWTAWAGSLPVNDWWLTEPDVGRVAHGVPARVDRLRALGNAVVPQLVEAIGRRILEADGLT